MWYEIPSFILDKELIRINVTKRSFFFSESNDPRKKEPLRVLIPNVNEGGYLRKLTVNQLSKLVHLEQFI